MFRSELSHPNSNLLNRTDCNYPFGIFNEELDQCRCRYGFYSLYIDSETCEFSSSTAWKIALRVIFLLTTLIALILWSLKLFLHFRNVSRKPFDLPKIIGYLWASGYLAIFILQVSCEAHLTGESLSWLSYVCFSLFEISSIAMLLYSRWFFLLCLSLLINVSPSMITLFNYLHYLVFGTLWALFVATGVVSTARSIAFSVVDTPGDASLYTVTMLFLLLVLAYVAFILMIPTILIWVRFTDRPPAVIQATRFLWVCHFVLGLCTLCLFILILTCLSLALSSGTIQSWQTLSMTAGGFALVFLVTLTSYFTITHKSDYTNPLANAESEVVSSILHPNTPLLPSPQLPRHLSPDMIGGGRFASVRAFVTRYSGWDHSGDFEDSTFDVPLLVRSDDEN